MENEKIRQIIEKKEIESKLEHLVINHIEMYEKRKMPCTEPQYIRNENKIIELANGYIKQYNECPKINLYELSFYLRGKR